MTASDTEKTLAELRDFDAFFHRQQDVLGAFAKLSFEANSENRLKSIYPLIDSIRTSAHATIPLLRQGLITESYILGRAYLERLVNACYLLVCDTEQFSDYIEFSMQKIQRSFETRKMAYAAIDKEVDVPDVSGVPIIAKGLAKFTSARGKEITRWTTLNIEKRIDFIHSRHTDFNSQLFIAVTRFIYEDASEAVHGTLYGALFHSGIFYGMQTPEAGEAYLNSTRRTMYMLLGLLIGELLVVASKWAPTKDLIAQSKSNFGDLHKYLDKEQPA